MEAAYIIESKKRCQEAGLQPDIAPSPNCRLSLPALHEQQHKFSEVMSVMGFFGSKIIELLEDTPILIVLTDEKGYILHFYGSETIKGMMNQLGIQESIQMNERDMGTNSVYLAQQQQKPLELVGTNHFHKHLHQAACYSVPFHFPDIDHLTGTVSMMTLLDFHSKFALPLFSNMVDSMEREIVLRRKSRNQDLINHIMINAVNNGIIITDRHGVIVEFNQLIEKITGCTREDAIGKLVFSFDVFAGYMQDILSTGKRFENVECTFNMGPNNRVVCLLDAIPILNDREVIIGAYLQIHDITERVELEKQIVTYEKFSAIGKLAAGIAHEIRNPLTTIMGFIQLLREKQANRTEETNSRYLEIVYNELLDLNKMVSDFVLMAKPSFPEKKEHVLQKLINDTIQFMIGQANLSNTTLTADLEVSPVCIFVDAVQIKQVLINLIQNAFEAMPNGGEVRVRLSVNRENGCAEIIISDSGVGIPEEHLIEVFNPFFTTKDNGLGLGLSICYRIIENHSGRIQVESKEGFGTRFIIMFPYLERD